MSFKFNNIDNVCHCNHFNGVFDRHLKGILTNSSKIETLMQIKRLLEADFPNYAPLTAWLIENLKSKSLSLIEQDFLVDTVRYITTGYRGIPLATYQSMLAEHYFTETGSSRYVTVTKMGKDACKERLLLINRTIETLNEIGDDLLNRWVSHEDGFSDIVKFFAIVSEPNIS